jgi:ribokinase
MTLLPLPDTPREWDVLGLGDIDVDMFLGVERLAGRDEKVIGTYLGEFPGGMIANVCCAASTLGAATAMIGRVGDDAYGAMAVQGLAEHGVDTSLVRVIVGGRTFYCVVMLDGTGEKALTVVDTDCHLPRSEDVDAHSFGRTRLVHLMGDDLEVASWAAQAAHERGTLVSLDLEAATAAHGLDALRPLLSDTDVLFMNSSGCRSAFAAEPDAAAARALRLGPKVVVVTCGAGGALAFADGTKVTVDGLRMPVVDTTGAGDCFIGAFLTGLLDGWELSPAARFAVAAASVSIGAVGSRNQLPSRAQALELMNQTIGQPLASGAS